MPQVKENMEAVMKEFRFFEQGFPKELTDVADMIANNIANALNKGKKFTAEAIMFRIKEDAVAYAKPKYYQNGEVVIYKATRYIEDTAFDKLMRII